MTAENLDYVRGHAACLEKIERVIDDGIKRSRGAKSVTDVVDIFNAVVRETYSLRMQQEEMVDAYNKSVVESHPHILHITSFPTPGSFFFNPKGGDKK